MIYPKPTGKGLCHEWNDWFAWRPVWIYGHWVWLETVHRRIDPYGDLDYHHDDIDC